ncbi:hypothetical protein D9M71_667610 [compost metagenome]
MQATTGQVEGHRGIHPALADRRHGCGAGAGAASLSFAGAAFPHAQVGAVAVDDLEEAGIHPLREAWVVFDLRAQLMHGGSTHVVDT